MKDSNLRVAYATSAFQADALDHSANSPKNNALAVIDSNDVFLPCYRRYCDTGVGVQPIHYIACALLGRYHPAVQIVGGGGEWEIRTPDPGDTPDSCFRGRHIQPLCQLSKKWSG